MLNLRIARGTTPCTAVNRRT